MDKSGIKNSIFAFQNYFSRLTKRILGKQNEFNFIVQKLKALSDETPSHNEILVHCVSSQKYVLSIIKTLFFIDSDFKNLFIENLKNELATQNFEDFNDFFEIVQKHKIDLSKFVSFNESQFFKLFGFENQIIKQKLQEKETLKISVKALTQRSSMFQTKKSMIAQLERPTFVSSRISRSIQSKKSENIKSGKSNQKSTRFRPFEIKIVKSVNLKNNKNSNEDNNECKPNKNSFFFQKKNVPVPKIEVESRNISRFLGFNKPEVQKDSFASNLANSGFQIDVSILKNEDILFLTNQLTVQIFMSMLNEHSDKIMLSFVDKFINIQQLIFRSGQDYNYFTNLMNIKSNHLKKLEKELQNIKTNEVSKKYESLKESQNLESLNKLEIDFKNAKYLTNKSTNYLNNLHNSLLDIYYHSNSLLSVNNVDFQIDLIFKITNDKKIKVDAGLLKKEIKELNHEIVPFQFPLPLVLKKIENMCLALNKKESNLTLFLSKELMLLQVFHDDKKFRRSCKNGEFDHNDYTIKILGEIKKKTIDFCEVFKLKISLFDLFLKSFQTEKQRKEQDKNMTSLMRNINQYLNPESLQKVKATKLKTMSKIEILNPDDEKENIIDNSKRFLRNNSNDKKFVVSHFEEIFKVNTRRKINTLEKERTKMNSSMDKSQQSNYFLKDKTAFNFKMLQKLKEGLIIRTN